MEGERVATRASQRPRVPERDRRLLIVRSVVELDNSYTEGLGLPGTQGTLEQQAAAAHMAATNPTKKKKEIPIPPIRDVVTYEEDYKPNYKQPTTYVRCRSINGWKSDYYIEYNLDDDDDKWLDAYNQGGQTRLAPEKLETMLHYLEILNAEATESHLRELGASEADRRTPAACNTLEHLTRSTAIDVLQRISGSRLAVCEAVYSFWRQKRKDRSRPVLRRLQAPTPIADNDPYKVFRPREKNKLPQTRRKKDNDVKSFEKLKEIRLNLYTALQLFDQVVRREKRKRDLTAVQLDQFELMMKQKFDPADRREAIEAEILERARQRARIAQAERAAGDGPLQPLGQGPAGAGTADRASNLRLVVGLANLLPRFNSKAKKYKASVKDLTKDPAARKEALMAVARLPAPPTPPDPALPFTLPPNVELAMQEKGLVVPEGVDLALCRPRFGRGGRIILDRCDPLTGEAYGPLSAASLDGAAGADGAGGASRPAFMPGPPPPLPADFTFRGPPPGFQGGAGADGAGSNGAAGAGAPQEPNGSGSQGPTGGPADGQPAPALRIRFGGPPPLGGVANGLLGPGPQGPGPVLHGQPVGLAPPGFGAPGQYGGHGLPPMGNSTPMDTN